MTNVFGFLMMGVIGLIVGSIGTGVSMAFGVSGWLGVAVISALVLLVIFLNDRLMGFEMG